MKMGSQITDVSFLSAANVAFLAELYADFLQNPSSVEPGWRDFFAGLGDDAESLLEELRGASWTPKDAAASNGHAPAYTNGHAEAAVAANGRGAEFQLPGASIARAEIQAAATDSIRALQLIRSYRVRGHLQATLDPLGLTPIAYHAELDPASYGFGPKDWDRQIFIGNVLGLASATLREIMAVLKATYCGNIGVEFMHISDPEQKLWIQTRIEAGRNHTDFTVNGKRAILSRLIAAEAFEQFLQVKYTGTKRFGLEGGESLIPAIEQVMKRGGQLGLKEIVLGMPHRGRLNVLTNVMGKSFTAIFSEFQGNAANPDDVQGSGDVKYHLGTSSDRDFDGNVVHLSLTANPSHLEAVNPVVVGKVRAKMMQRGDKTGEQVMGMLLHGDAAFAGQGLVPETLVLSELAGYATGGTIHFIVNNQIGFTTSPAKARSGPYPSNVAKTIEAPIFHVNGDDPEAVVHVSRIATEFRQKFRKDVIVDIVCYRRHGHNEGDEPGFTQPVMYRTIAAKPTTAQIYARQLVEEKVLTETESDKIRKDFTDMLEQAFDAAPAYRPNKADWLEGRWAGLTAAPGTNVAGDTGVGEEALRAVGAAITRVPDDFAANSKIVRQLKAKEKMFETGAEFDWATAEAMAFGSLLQEGFPVRLSGQDVGRGTFSQRHSVLYDQNDGRPYIPLAGLARDKAYYEIIDSPLSEAAVLGFEYGYSLAEPRALVLWEAQFGDFVNGAQVIIDQFIASSESKWLRMSGLVMLLPHGMEGQGPEHSSGRPERFLQLCAEDNLQVVNITTPANYFHALRRQIHRSFRKPLIVMSPKSLLRHKLAVSQLSDFTTGTNFHRVLGETEALVDGAQVRRVVLCTGKVYYDLYQERETRKRNDVAIVRVEQLYPFPGDAIALELKKYPNADVVWCQEEPENQGYWWYMDRRIEGAMKDVGNKYGRPRYVGRPAAAAPATGLLRRHNREQALLLDEALTPG
jgi:2-oxoglutarate dehydrogenase E1 component